MAEKNAIEIVISATNKASEGLKEASSSISNFAEKHKKTFENMGKYGAAAFYGITSVVNTATQAYADSEKQLAKVDQILENTAYQDAVKGFDYATKAVRDFGAEMQSLTGYGDEEASEVFAKFIQYTGEYSDSMEMAKLAMDLATYSGQDLNSVQKQLMLAFDGSPKLLKQFGIEIDDNADKMTILEAIYDQVGGQAETFGKTLAGQQKILSQTRGDMREVIGEALLPIVSELTKALVPLIQNFANWAQEHKELVKRILLISGGLSGIIAIIGGIGLVLPTLATGFKFFGSALGAIGKLIPMISGGLSALGPIFAAILSPIGLIVTALAALGVAYATNLWGFRDAVDSMVAKIKPLLKELRQDFKKKFDEIWLTIKETRDEIEPILTPIWEGFQQVVNVVLKVVVESIKAFAKIFIESFKSIFQVLWEAINFLKNVFTGNWKGAFQNLQNIASTWGSFIINVFKTLGSMVSNILSAFGINISGIWNNLFSGLKNACSSAVDWIVNKIQGALNMIQSAKDKVSSVASSAWTSTKNFASNARSAIGGRASGGEMIAGQLYRINELGAEYFRPAVNGRMERQSQASASFNINFGSVVINNGMDLAQFEERIRNVIYKEQQRANLGYF